MIKLNNLNRKGFTLVELLAVIVVLAIIMIVAVPAVINTMNDAQKGTFKIFAERAITKAQEKYQLDLMVGETKHKNGNDYCYELEDLELGEKSTYNGFVEVTLDANLKPAFKVTISDASFSMSDATYSDLVNDTIQFNPPTTGLECP
ncbi:MAG: type II secretion system protein [Bacilli bacterium]|nr:type II secretion system protein [Bacilli bacterium]MDD4796022.1 type II secretion system protein [Bacilli bacterium]